MMSVELKHHPEEWFFLHNFDIDKVFSTIQRADYLGLRRQNLSDRGGVQQSSGN